jgi:LDH2 family malate/lactate/ureidoglycolate dehydrogenase
MNSSEKDGPYPHETLLDFAETLLIRAGLVQHRARVVADILLEGDLMGHSTHGLQLLGSYLRELEEGRMRKSGDPGVISDGGSAVCWDGRYLPGPWLTVQAIETAMQRIANHPVVTFVIRRSHHIAALASYPKRVTDRKKMILLCTSDPSVRSVAPFGGITPLYTPNPIAAGIPTRTEPIIIDTSMSCLAVGAANRLVKKSKRAPYPWFMDGRGNPTEDAAVLNQDPPGSILPLGGIDLGFKGFALGLLIEALTGGLGGSSRAAGISRWGASVFLQIIDPDAFGGFESFSTETQWLSEACRSSSPRPNSPGVRLPGERALALREQQLSAGIRLYPGIISGLKEWAGRYGVPIPSPT